MSTERVFPLAVMVWSIVAGAALADVRSEWAFPGRDAKLVYRTTPKGDRIMDFSHAGYMGGGVALPKVAVARRVKPSGGPDDTQLIQSAIDDLASRPIDRGFRGAVLLEPGLYRCSNTIRIAASGIVLRGSPGTIIQMTGRPHNAISIRSADRAPEREPSVETTITNDYVPSGANAFNVASTTGFKAGDRIEIRRPVTEAWIRFMQMDDLTRDGRPQTWLRAGTTIDTERQIAAIRGNTIILDVPLSDSFDATYLNPPGTKVVKIAPSNRVTQSGIEDLNIECPPQPISHTQPHFTAIRMNGEDCWVSDVTCHETMNSVAVNGRRITLQRVTVNRTARHEGSSRPAEFAPNASQVLLDRCAVHADNVWFVATGARVSGPIVLLNCNFTGTGRAESHQRWSTGMLYDNCLAPEGGFEFRNRGSMGSGHGWSMGWGVAWNCIAKDYVIQNPPGALNWIIGSRGELTPKPRPFDREPMLPGGEVDSHGTAVAPRSLYLAQLEERLGPQALRNIGHGDNQQSLRWRKQNLFVGPFENCTTADLNQDGHLDIVYGPYWFAGPDFVPRAYRAHFVGSEYLRNNSDHVLDVDRDGWPDIISGFWDTNGIWWYKNPGLKHLEEGKGWEMIKPWQGFQLITTRGRMEMFALHDYDGDGLPEIHSACYSRKEPLEVFRFTNSPSGAIALQPFILGREGGGHGLAFGDVNGDGREDVLCEIGWYERPPGDPFAQPWKLHPETDLSKMHPSCPFVVKDLNQDGRLDLIFGRGHDYGLYWWEQLPPKPDGTTVWKQHLIDDTWSQAHALSLADLNGDGQAELIAGKCLWAHDAGDPGAADPPAIYYYQWDRATQTFTRHTIAAPGEGIALGRQFSIVDLNKDGRPDLLAPSKHSFWVLYNDGYNLAR